MSTIETFGSRASIAGYVRDASSGLGLGGATVELVAEEVATVTRADGFYTFLDLPEASYTIRAVATRMGSRYAAVTVSDVAVASDASGRPVFDVKATVSLPPTRLTGLVRRSDTLAPIPNADVQLRASQVRAKSNKLGQYALSAVEAGTQTVQVSAPGFTAASQPVSLTQGEETVVEFSLTAG